MKFSYLRVCTLFIFAVIIFLSIRYRPGNILAYDNFGYYLYLPLKFIYHDLGLKHVEAVNLIISKYHNTGSFYQAFKTPEGDFVLKYPMGIAFCYSPFFFIGDFAAKVLSYPADGFSAPYQYAILLGGIICALIGIYFLSRVLRHFFSDNISAIVLILVVFSTNYLLHVTYHGQNAMSHNYLFTLYALILWLTIKWHQSQKWVHGLLLAFFCGIAIISRLSELVCLLIPLFWGVYNKATLIEKVRLLKKNKFQVISFLLVLFVTISPQLIYWKIHTGHFLFYSYANNPGEGFDFSSPYWREFLFSFRKGWLIYTPVMGFAVLGFLALFKYNRSIFYALFIYFILNLYIVSSWSCWWYAQSFSQRAVIQSYPVMAVTLGYFILWLRNQKKYLRYPVIGMMICFLLLNLFQSFQTVKGVLSGDRMTRNYYFATFGKLKVSQADTRLLLVNRSFIGKEQVEHDSDYTPRRLVAHTFENDGGEISGFARTGDLSRKMDSLNPYAPGWTSPYYLLTRKDHAWLRLSAYVYPTKSFKESPFGCVAHFIHQGKAYKYVFIPTDTSGLAMNKWNKVVFEYLTPEVRSRQDTLKMYLFLKGKYPVYCDDITVDVLEPKFDNH